MKIINITVDSVTIIFSKAEFFMLYAATGGDVFLGNTKRNIPAVNGWTKDEAMYFEKRIQKEYDDYSGNEIFLSKKEMLYLATIHQHNMEEIDPIEYPTIVGYDYTEAQKLLSEMKMALAS